MNIEKVSSEGLKSVFKVVISSDAVSKALDAETVIKAKNVKMHGFRPGHVPTSIVRKLKQDEIRRDALEKLITNACNDVLKQSAVKELATKPTFKLDNAFEEGKDLSITLTVEETPEFELKPYDFEITKIVPNVSQSEVEEVQRKIIENSPVREDADENYAIKPLDQVFYSAIYSKSEKHDKSKNVASSVVIPKEISEDNEFHKQLIGKKTNESFDFLPKDQENVKYKVTINKIKKALTEISLSDYATKVGFKNLEEWTDLVKKSLENNIINHAYLYHKSQIIEALMNEYSFELPKSIVEQEGRVILHQIKSELAKSENKNEKELNKTDEELMTEYADTINKRVLLGYIFNKIAQKEHVIASEEEVNQAVYAEIQSNPGMAEQIIEYYRKNPILLQYKRAEITERKVVDFLVSNVKTKEEKKTLKEVEEIVNKLLEEDEDGGEKNEKQPSNE